MALRTYQQSIQIGQTRIEAGQKVQLQLYTARLPTQTPMSLPVQVIHGAHAGSRLWLSAAIHGDELNGLEIINRVVDRIVPTRLKGTLIAAPVVNVFGFIQQDRYLPDRRDLNRCFPGSKGGSLASRLACLFMTEIVGRCTHGIDLHTASNHRINLPQVRGNLQDKRTRDMAHAFGAPMMIHGESPRGSLREAVSRKGIPIIVYEAGEPKRFNPNAIETGYRGVLRVMAHLAMIEIRSSRVAAATHVADKRTWIRAKRSGILHLKVRLGQWVMQDQVLGVITDAFGEDQSSVTSPDNGLILGYTNYPLVNQGDAIIHLARNVTTTQR